MGTETYNSANVPLLFFTEEWLVEMVGYGFWVCISAK